MATKTRRRGKLKIYDKLVITGFAGMLIFFIVMVVISFKQDTKNKNTRFKADQEVAEALATPSPTATPPLVNPPADKSSGTSSSSRKQALDAAVMALEAISAAQFQLPADRSKVISQWVLPSLAGEYETNLAEDGQKLAQAWGWTSTYEAFLYAQYGATTKMYKVDSFNNGKAVIRLYTLSRHQERGVTPPPENQVVLKRYTGQPGITVVKMRNQDGKWWYSGRANLPPGQRPQFGPGDTEDHLTSAEAVRRYKPFVKGFSRYVYSREDDG
jgi:hypothetical protein